MGWVGRAAMVSGTLGLVLAAVLCVHQHVRAEERSRHPAASCLRTAFSHGLRDAKTFSQFGEDGILQAIFGCIGHGTKYYVEFGVEDGKECTTRLLREQQGWAGLMLDGGYHSPEINLRKATISAETIVGLFEAHAVPKPGRQARAPPRGSAAAAVHKTQRQGQQEHMRKMGRDPGTESLQLDQLTVDIDMNTFWVLREVLQAGYRPRSLTVEMNRNLGPDLSFAAVYMPRENWQIDDVGELNTIKSMKASCYYGASATAVNRLVGYYGYYPVAVDENGINVFYVLNSTVGYEPVFTWAEVLNNVESGIVSKHYSSGYRQGYGARGLHRTWASLHSHCQDSVWLEVKEGFDFGRGGLQWPHGHPSHWAFPMRPVLLRHKPVDGTNRRHFYQPRGLPRFAIAESPQEGAGEEQYHAQEDTDQPTVQFRLQQELQGSNRYS